MVEDKTNCCLNLSITKQLFKNAVLLHAEQAQWVGRDIATRHYKGMIRQRHGSASLLPGRRSRGYLTRGSVWNPNPPASSKSLNRLQYPGHRFISIVIIMAIVTYNIAKRDHWNINNNNNNNNKIKIINIVLRQI